MALYLWVILGLFALHQNMAIIFLVAGRSRRLTNAGLHKLAQPNRRISIPPVRHSVGTGLLDRTSCAGDMPLKILACQAEIEGNVEIEA
jgi:hypothetical protein